METINSELLKEIIQRQSNIEKLMYTQKNVFTFEECKKYTGLSSSHLYKLTSRGLIPHFKPQGKYIYFDRIELEKWLLRNPVKLQEEIEQEAIKYTTLKKGGVL